MPRLRRLVSASALFRSATARILKEQLCEMGRRGWQRGLFDGSSGNLSARLGDSYLCTPTGVSKGFMRPEMIVLVDAAGTQVDGAAPWRRTSEILAHLAVYRAAPLAAAVIHAHPPHATAYAVAEQVPPGGLLTEAELVLGSIALAPYATPGDPRLGEALTPLAAEHRAILLARHGALCWGTSTEDAYLRMESLETCCQTLAVAAQLPGRRRPISAAQQAELTALRQRLNSSGAESTSR